MTVTLHILVILSFSFQLHVGTRISHHVGSIIYLPDQTIPLAVGLGVGIPVLLGVMVSSGILIKRKYFPPENTGQPDRTDRDFTEVIDIGPLPTTLTLTGDQGNLDNTGATPRPEGYLSPVSGKHGEGEDTDEQRDSRRTGQNTRRAVITMYPSEDTYFDIVNTE